MDEPTATNKERALPPTEDTGARLFSQARNLMEEGRPGACLGWVENGGVPWRPEALQALCALITPPTALRRRLRWRRKEWSCVRVAAIQALRTLGDPAALPTLARTLLYDPDAEVRANASDALCAFGPQATPHLLGLLRESTDWSNDGMLALISTLGKLGDKTAGPSLARILCNWLPRLPRRWTSLPLKVSALCTLLFLLIGISVCCIQPEDLGPALFMGCLLYAPAWLLIYLFLFLPPSLSQQRFTIRRLHIATAEALSALKDKNALPSLIQATYNSLSGPAQLAAQETLALLFSLIGPEDAGLISPRAERYLLADLNANPPERTLRIVRALEFIGTGQAARPVSRLTRLRPGANDSFARMELRAEAERILPILEERSRQEQHAGLLLRAADHPPTPTEALLRPSQERLETPAEQLLRPTQGSSE